MQNDVCVPLQLAYVIPMVSKRLPSDEAAARLGISRATLYDWLSQSNAGSFILCGVGVTINYYQSGRRGQGRIQIDASEIERLLSLMKITPDPLPHRTVRKKPSLTHITAPLGRPED